MQVARKPSDSKAAWLFGASAPVEQHRPDQHGTADSADRQRRGLTRALKHEVGESSRGEGRANKSCDFAKFHRGKPIGSIRGWVTADQRSGRPSTLS